LINFAEKIFERMKVKIVNKSAFDLPQYATLQSAGLDLRANISEPVTLKPLERKLIPTGLFIELPDGYEAQIRPRSGLAIKHGISLVNTPGTIDPDYRGEIGVIVINLSNSDFVLNAGERIAQMVICKFERIEWESVDDLSTSERGGGGFGSTGK
jgi:dUTP pyrophosphatase